jgi:hypothetical protein
MSLAYSSHSLPADRQCHDDSGARSTSHANGGLSKCYRQYRRCRYGCDCHAFVKDRHSTTRLRPDRARLHSSVQLRDVQVVGEGRVIPEAPWQTAEALAELEDALHPCDGEDLERKLHKRNETFDDHRRWATGFTSRADELASGPRKAIQTASAKGNYRSRTGQVIHSCSCFRWVGKQQNDAGKGNNHSLVPSPNGQPSSER